MISALRPRRLAALFTFVLPLLFTVPAAAQDLASYAQQVLGLVNVERAKVGLRPLARAPELDSAAQKHSQSMADNGFFSHTGLDGSSPFDRMRQAGYNFLSAGENVAYGYATPQAVMDAWMNSPGHRDNILQPLYTEIGIGVAVRGGTSGPIYWTQDFGSRQGGAPPLTPPSVRPSLTGITPASARPGDRVSLAGSALGSAGTVTFPAGQTARVVAWSDTRVDVEVPQGAQSGDVYLQNGAGTSNGVRFEVLSPTGPPSSRDGDPAPGDPNRPRIDAIAGNTLGFVTIATLTGRNFGWFRGTVTFNGVAATVISAWSPERIELLVPWNATSGPVVVTTEMGSSPAFLYNVPGQPPL